MTNKTTPVDILIDIPSRKENPANLDKDISKFILPPQTTLPGVIVKVKKIAREQYENKIYDNILSVYAQLETSEKRILLKGLIGLCYMVEERLLHESVMAQEVKSEISKVSQEVKQTIHSEFGDIEKINKIELIKLKSWMVKAGAITVMAGLLGIVIIIAMFKQEGSEDILQNFTFFQTMVEVLKTAIGL